MRSIMIAGLFTLCAAGFLPMGALAADAGKSQALMIDGKPIDISCLIAMDTYDSSRFDLAPAKNCAHDKIVPERGKSSEGGMIGFSYRYKGDDPSSASSYFYYSYLGEHQGQQILFTQSGGGGTGHFTNVFGLKRQGDKLKRVAEYAGGDRCNGGVENAKIVGDKISVRINATPAAIIELTEAAPEAVFAALDDSAISCAGLVTLEIATTPKSQAIAGLQLNEDYARMTRATTGAGPEQACFNALFADYKARDQMALDGAQTREFAKAFRSKCVTKK